MNATTTAAAISKIKIFWGTRGEEDSNWWVSWYIGNVHMGYEKVFAAFDDLDAAIAQGVYQINANVRVDDFARCPKLEGGYAEWSV